MRIQGPGIHRHFGKGIELNKKLSLSKVSLKGVKQPL